MKVVKPMCYSINAIYSLMVLVFILDLFSVVEVKGQQLDSFITFGTLIFTPFIVACNVITFKITRQTLLICIPSVCLILIFLMTVFEFGLLGYLLSRGNYKTQTILYENRNCTFKTIEFQMKDVGALGYNERYVEVTYLTPWFMITEDFNPKQKLRAEWVKVDKEVNELNIVY